MIHDKLLAKNGQYVRALDAAAGGAEVELLLFEQRNRFSHVLIPL